MSDINFASSVESLIGGTADSFVVGAGAGIPVDQLNAAQARALLGLATVATTGAYSDLSGRPSLGTAATQESSAFAAASHSHAISDVTGLQTALDGKRSATTPYYIEVALSANGSAITAGTFKGLARVHTAGTITGLVIDCDPNNEPSAAAVQVDLNTVNRTTGAATSVLSAVASIATGANTGTGTISGSPSVAAGDLLSLDIDQGSDGKELLATIEITPS